MSDSSGSTGGSADAGTTLNIGGGQARAQSNAAPREGFLGRAQDLAAHAMALPMLQKLIIGTAAVMLAAIVITVAMSGRSKEDYQVLFSGVSERDGAAIIAALQQSNVPYKFTPGGSAIMVPGPVVHETRLRLAGQGLPKAGTVGFELLENQKLGTSQFVEQINYQRGLEGELSKTIGSMTQVKMARVHVAIPKQSAFSRDAQRPTASVVLTMHPGRFLDDGQVIAVTNLVSSSIPQMSPQSVTVMDSEGNLLAPNPSRMGALGLDATQLKYVSEVEGTIAKRIATIVEPVAGRENVRAQVSVELDFTQIERTEESFTPNSPPEKSAIRSQQSLEATGPITTAGGIPGALSNQPPQPAQSPLESKPPTQQGGATATSPLTGMQTSNANRKESTFNYEVDRAIQTTKPGRGQIKHVSAAVILNFKKGVDKAGKPTSVPFSADEMKQINQMVRDAMGFNQQRGDSVSVSNIPFNVEPAEDTSIWRDAGFQEMGKEFLKYGLLAGALGFVFLGVVRPILFPPPKAEGEEAQRMEEEFDEKIKAELATMSPQAREKRRLEIELEKERRRLEEEDKRMREDEDRLRLEEDKRRSEDERKRLEEDKQREYEELITYAKDYVTKDPRVVASIFKEWLGQVKDK